MATTILIVDDEKNIRRTLRMVLEGAGHRVLEAGDTDAALSVFASEDVDLAIVDVRLPGASGIELLQTLRKTKELVATPVVMISGHASLAEAVHSVQLGAADFLEKPLDRDRVLVSISNALDSDRMRKEVRRLRDEVAGRHEMIGESPIMAQLYGAIEKVAPTRGRVLITGESGTGKELIARAVHRASDRRDAAFVMLNCAAIPTELIESELFGHERGAFTGAHGRKKGMFEVADGGTLFLDEIGDMSLGAQAKVLRALQSGEISRVGGERSIAVDVRILAATNKNLEAAVAAGQFRDDLYFRLNVVPLHSPSLRERTSDIPLLARSFFEDFGREYGGRARVIDPQVYEVLKRRAWPGNVRELKNVIERMVILCGERIGPEDVPRDERSAGPGPSDTSPVGGFVVPLPSDAPMELREFRDRAETEYIRAVVERCEWNISRAATELGVERTNLHKKMRVFGIRRGDGS